MTTPPTRDTHEQPPSPSAKPKHPLDFLRSRFLAGLITIIPTIVTIWAISLMVGLLDAYVASRLRGPLAALFELLGWPTALLPTATFTISLLVVLGGILVVGILTRFLVVRRLIRVGENIVERIPLVRFFYITPKEVIKTFTETRKAGTKRVVMIEFPRRGSWVLGYATSEMMHMPDGRRVVNVFMPTTPNPTTGFLMMVPAEDVYDINMTTEDAVRFIISGGILTPEHVHRTPFVGLHNKPDLPPPEPLVAEASIEAPPAGSKDAPKA